MYFLKSGFYVVLPSPAGEGKRPIGKRKVSGFDGIGRVASSDAAG